MSDKRVDEVKRRLTRIQMLPEAKWNRLQMVACSAMPVLFATEVSELKYEDKRSIREAVWVAFFSRTHNVESRVNST